MKKNLFALFALFVSAAMLIGCGNDLEEATVSGGSVDESQAFYGTVDVNGIDASKLEVAYSKARTIVPTPYNLNDTLTWVIEGTSSRGGVRLQRQN